MEYLAYIIVSVVSIFVLWFGVSAEISHLKTENKKLLAKVYLAGDEANLHSEQ